jgi:hypothetical protein
MHNFLAPATYGEQWMGAEMERVFKPPFSTTSQQLDLDIVKALPQRSDALVLDFFAGSGTTGHAVRFCAEDRGSRRVISVLPEPTAETRPTRLGTRPFSGDLRRLGWVAQC